MTLKKNKQTFNSQDCHPHQRLIQPRFSIVPVVGNNGLCLTFLADPSFQSKYPAILPPQAFPTPAPSTPHLPHPIWLLSHQASAAPEPGWQSLGTWPGSGASERKFPRMPERCSSQSGCQRHCSKPWPHRQRLQQKRKYSLRNINWSPAVFLGYMLGKRKTDKIPTLKEFLIMGAEGIPRWFTK